MVKKGFIALSLAQFCAFVVFHILMIDTIEPNGLIRLSLYFSIICLAALMYCVFPIKRKPYKYELLAYSILNVSLLAILASTSITIWLGIIYILLILTNITLCVSSYRKYL